MDGSPFHHHHPSSSSSARNSSPFPTHDLSNPAPNRHSRNLSSSSYPLADLEPRPYLDSPSNASASHSRSPMLRPARPADDVAGGGGGGPSQARVTSANSIPNSNSPSRYLRSDAYSPSPSRSRSRSSRGDSLSRLTGERSGREGGSGRGERIGIRFAGPPPPIASVILPPPSSSQKSGRNSGLGTSRLLGASSIIPTGAASAAANPITGLIRTEKALQAELQSLLDAQAAALLRGRGAGGGGLDAGDAASETSSSTVTGRSGSRSRLESTFGSGGGGGVVPVRQPRKKILSLRGARKGILAAMEELCLVKEAQAVLLSDEKAGLEAVLKQVRMWESKLGRFEKEIKRIVDGDGGGGSGGGSGRGGGESMERELIAERAAVQGEIRELEYRLAELRARERVLGQRVREGENRREAKLSSFREGKGELEREVGVWLRRPGVEDVAGLVWSLDGSRGERTEDDVSEGGGGGGKNEIDEEIIPFLTLPPGRRTLPLAISFLSSSITAVARATKTINHEHAALLAGIALWADTIELVTNFEKSLKTKIQSNAAAPGTGNLQGNLQENLREMVGEMENVAREVERREGKALGEGWNLLVCVLGAEGEVLREGVGVLRGVIGVGDDDGGDLIDASAGIGHKVARGEAVIIGGDEVVGGSGSGGEGGAEGDGEGDGEGESFLTAPLGDGDIDGGEDELSSSLRTGHGIRREELLNDGFGGVGVDNNHGGGNDDDNGRNGKRAHAYRYGREESEHNVEVEGLKDLSLSETARELAREKKSGNGGNVHGSGNGNGNGRLEEGRFRGRENSSSSLPPPSSLLLSRGKRYASTSESEEEEDDGGVPKGLFVGVDVNDGDGDGDVD